VENAVLTVESAKKELDDIRQQFFAAIGRLMDEGLNHQDALIQAYKNNPDWDKRERQLRDFLKMAAQFQVESNDSRAGRGGKENVKLTASERESALKAIDTMLERMIREKMADAKLQYHEALKLVACENRQLDERRTALMRNQ